MLFVVGYACYLFGYVFLIRKHGARRIALPTQDDMTGWVARLAIAACVAIGVFNCLYLLVRYPGGPAGYLPDFGQGANRFDDIARPVTTCGYQFLYAGVFL